MAPYWSNRSAVESYDDEPSPLPVWLVTVAILCRAVFAIALAAWAIWAVDATVLRALRAALPTW